MTLFFIPAKHHCLISMLSLGQRSMADSLADIPSLFDTNTADWQLREGHISLSLSSSRPNSIIIPTILQSRYHWHANQSQWGTMFTRSISKWLLTKGNKRAGGTLDPIHGTTVPGTSQKPNKVGQCLWWMSLSQECNCKSNCWLTETPIPLSAATKQQRRNATATAELRKGSKAQLK